MPIRTTVAAALVLLTGGLAWGQGGDVPMLGVYENQCLPGVTCTIVLSAQAGQEHPVLAMEVTDVRREPYRLLCRHEGTTRPGVGRTASGGEEVEGLVATIGGIRHVVSALGDRDVLVSATGYPCVAEGRPVPTVGIYDGQATD